VEKTGHTEVDLSVRLTPDELKRELKRRGLPLEVFGIDRPVLDLQQTNGAKVVPNAATLQGNGGASLLAFDDDENDGGNQ
jgi:hypothetical protein